MSVDQDEQEKLSVTLKFQSLCQFFSSIDPAGLLGLPAAVTTQAVTMSSPLPSSSTQVVSLVMCRSDVHSVLGVTDA